MARLLTHVRGGLEVSQKTVPSCAAREPEIGVVVERQYATDVRLVSKMEGTTIVSRHLQVVRNRDC